MRIPTWGGGPFRTGHFHSCLLDEGTKARVRVRSDGSRGSEKRPAPRQHSRQPFAADLTRPRKLERRSAATGSEASAREAAELLRRLLDAGLSEYEPDPMARLSASRPRRNRSEDAPCPSRFPTPNSQIPLASMVKGVLTSLYTRPGCCAAVSQFRFFERMRDCRDRVAIRSKTTIKREDFTTEPFFSCRPAISNEPDFNRPSKCHLRQVGSVI